MARCETDCNNVLGSVTRRSYQVVIAATRDMGLGMNMKLPWDLPNEFKFFQEVTTKTLDPKKRNATIMGRRSWESTPLEIRPLPGRLNIVLTSSSSLDIATDHENVLVCSSMETALELLAIAPYSLSIEKVFVIGGGELLRHYMNAPSCEAIHLTEIDISVPCDAFAPRVDTSLYRPWYSSLPVLENGTRYSFNTYVRRKDTTVENKSVSVSDHETKQYSFLPKLVFERHEEFCYLNLAQNIISNGDMNGDKTLSKFGSQMRFNLRKTFPLLTTMFKKNPTSSQKVIWLGIVEEILQLINGSTNHISDVINKIKNNPHDQLACNHPLDFKLSLSSPHTFAQYYVANGELSCQIYQSLTEASLEIPFSITAYSLLTCIIAHVCDLVVGDFTHVIGQAYVNTSHVETLQKQLQISPKPFPILKINPEKKKIDSFESSDFELLGI